MLDAEVLEAEVLDAEVLEAEVLRSIVPELWPESLLLVLLSLETPEMRRRSRKYVEI